MHHVELFLFVWPWHKTEAKQNSPSGNVYVNFTSPMSKNDDTEKRTVL